MGNNNLYTLLTIVLILVITFLALPTLEAIVKTLLGLAILVLFLLIVYYVAK
jgi:hypothetical protein